MVFPKTEGKSHKVLKLGPFRKPQVIPKTEQAGTQADWWEAKYLGAGGV